MGERMPRDIPPEFELLWHRVGKWKPGANRVYCKRVGPDGSLPPCHCKGDYCVADTAKDRD